MNCHLKNTPEAEGTFLAWDENMRKIWLHLTNPPLFYHKKDNITRKECKWVAPLIGWKKLKFDGASRGNPGKAGLGYIVRSENGYLLLKWAKPLGNVTNNIAELEALKEGLKLSIKINIRKLIIEGDSQVNLNAIRKWQTLNWILNAKLKSFHNLIYQFEEIIIQHIYREGNLESDKLANKGVEEEDFMYLVEQN